MRRLVAAILVATFTYGASPARAQQPGALPAQSGVRELRLGVVCYGGLSLAVYMFGTTRELHHLLRASQALELDGTEAPHTREAGFLGANGSKLPASARPYYELLRRKWQAEGVRTRVVVDIITGTSAGGINGVILGKAIATGAPIADLRNLWFEEADIRRLAGHRVWLPWVIGRVLFKKPALLGDNWLREIYGAFERMDAGKGVDLMPSDGDRSLHVLVTGTDLFGSRRLVEIGDPPTSPDVYHSHVFHFVHPPRTDGIPLEGKLGNAALAFAARSSASFPVVFPPTSVHLLVAALPEKDRQDIDPRVLARELYGHQLADRGRCGPSEGSELPETCQDELASKLFLVDGGALDNKPLGLAFRMAGRTIPSVPAQRVFLYLEPDPQPLPLPGPVDRDPEGPNSWQTALAVLFSVRGAEPIGGDFRELAAHNDRVDRLLDVVAYNEWVARIERDETPRWRRAPTLPLEKSVATQVEEVVSYDLAEIRPAPVSKQEITDQREELEKDAASAQPLANEAYLRLRVQSVLAQLARVLASDVCDLPEDYVGPRTSLAEEIVYQWAEGRRIKAGAEAGTEPLDAASRAEFLAAWDLGYLRRNLRFVLAWVDRQYPGGGAELAPSESYDLTPRQVEEAHSAITRGILELSTTLGARNLRALVGDDALLLRFRGAVCESPDYDRYRSVGEQATAILDQQRAEIDAFVAVLEPKLRDVQEGIRSRLFQDFAQQTAGWASADARRAVLARYLGFPFWDRVAYPYTAFSGTGELVRADVRRLSPVDARSLSDRGAARLAGSQKKHFGAFLGDAGVRQKDYLWGRLDGADRLMALLDRDATREPLFQAIVEEEKPILEPEVWRAFDDCVRGRPSGDCNVRPPEPQ